MGDFGIIGALFIAWMVHPVICSLIVSGIVAAIALMIYIFKHLRWQK